MVRLENAPIRKLQNEERYVLHDSNGNVVSFFKTRNDALDYNHQMEIQKIKRIKALESLYSRYRGLSLYGVNT